MKCTGNNSTANAFSSVSYISFECHTDESICCSHLFLLSWIGCSLGSGSSVAVQLCHFAAEENVAISRRLFTHVMSESTPLITSTRYDFMRSFYYHNSRYSYTSDKHVAHLLYAGVLKGITYDDSLRTISRSSNNDIRLKASHIFDFFHFSQIFLYITVKTRKLKKNSYKRFLVREKLLL